jgi:hypothetical protein
MLFSNDSPDLIGRAHGEHGLSVNCIFNIMKIRINILYSLHIFNFNCDIRICKAAGILILVGGRSNEDETGEGSAVHTFF